MPEEKRETRCRTCAYYKPYTGEPDEPVPACGACDAPVPDWVSKAIGDYGMEERYDEVSTDDGSDCPAYRENPTTGTGREK